MSGSSKKTPALLAGLVVLALALGGGYFYISGEEKKMTQNLEALIKEYGFTAASVKVSFWDKSAEITGVKGTKPYLLGSTMTLEIEKLVGKGININALNEKGVVPLVDSMTANNLTMTVENLPTGGAPMKQETKAATAVLTKARGDLAALISEGKSIDFAAAAKSPESVKENREALTRLFTILRGFHIESLALTNYGSRIEGLPTPIVTSMDTYELKGMSLLSCDGFSVKGIKVNVMNQDMATIGGMQGGTIAIPDVFTPLLADPNAFSEDPLPIFLAALQKNPFQMSDFALTDVNVKVMMPESVTLKRFSMDLRLNDTTLEVKESVEDLVIPPSYYSKFGGEAAQFAELYGETLRLSGNFDVTATQKGGKGDLLVKNAGLKESALGAVTLDFAAIFSAPDADTLQKLLNSSDVLWLLKNAKLVVEDKKAVELGLKTQLPSGSANSPEADIAAIRKMASGAAKQEAGTQSNPDMKALMEGAAQLVEQPGTLTVIVNPKTPQPMDIRNGLSDTPGAYNISTQFTPGTAVAK